MADENDRSARKRAALDVIVSKEKARNIQKRVAKILKKSVVARTDEDNAYLAEHPGIVEELGLRFQKRVNLKQKEKEVEDAIQVLHAKCQELADKIRQAKNLVVYTGAGISTSAAIPDYRGPSGVWTLLRKGQSVKTRDISYASPTLTHMSLVQLHRVGIVKHVVSQNCDGLHMRSGLPRASLSELHGNMYVEVCSQCRKEYVRSFDVTERTSFRRHGTGRFCHNCKSHLRDTIVHFGEKGDISLPVLNWGEAATAAKNADAILCLGSSLKVLRSYACLWAMEKKSSDRPKLYIVNLQWTPKDGMAAMKINGDCDRVVSLLMHHLDLNIPAYSEGCDPLLTLATPLLPKELSSTTRHMIDSVDEADMSESDSIMTSTKTRHSSGSDVIPPQCTKNACVNIDVEKVTNNKCKSGHANALAGRERLESSSSDGSSDLRSHTHDASMEHGITASSSSQLDSRTDVSLSVVKTEADDATNKKSNKPDALEGLESMNKSASCQHIEPGWFGKGLKIKNRKRKLS